MTIVPDIIRPGRPQGADQPALVDPFGRAITYIRVSVTDRCDFRCVYCMSEDMNFLPKRDLLTLEELDRLCSAFVARARSASPAVSRWCAVAS
jgi:cyclic pyranopterin phosphate synthase